MGPRVSADEHREDPADSAGAIEVLPPEMIDQIAAGEVVERPASVVKELVENALDAGATHITVDVEEGGKRLIRVLDNGRGMSAKEAELSLRRHATSKLRSIDDLFSLSTMGFRGEALPSIAAVSNLAMITRRRDATAATRLAVQAGAIAERREVGAPVGTQIEVADLLHNVPARQKFLKGEATEASHITEAVSRLAMAHPEVHFRLRHGSRTSIDAPRAKDGLERAKKLLGARAGADLHAVEGYEQGVRVRAYLASPARAQTTARGVQLFVGRRWVRDRSLLHAVVMGYGELVPKGRYPVAVVFVDAPGERVDVNVHPQKLEVRFSDQRAVCAAVRHAVSRAVSRAPWVEGALDVGAGSLRMEPAGGGARASEMAARYAEARASALGPADRPAQGERRGLSEVAFPVAPRGEQVGPSPAEGGAPNRGVIGAGGRGGAERGRVARAPGFTPASDPVPERDHRPAENWARVTGDVASDESDTGDVPAASIDARAGEASISATGPMPASSAGFAFSDLTYLGQLERTYLVCEAAGELVLLDQHAAHERVVFERLRERYQDRKIPAQALLFPRELDLEAGERASLAEHADTLAGLGFDMDLTDEAASLRAYPADLREHELEKALSELAGDLADRGGSRAVEERSDRAIATIACHGSVRAGDQLTDGEVDALLAALDETPRRTHCPHGRPVLLRISVAEIARRFGRT